MITCQQLINQLKYLTCPNIVFIVEQLSHQNLDLQVRHLQIAKQVLQYLKRTITFDIEWDTDPVGHQSKLRENYGELDMVKYTNNSYVGDIDNKKSITRYYFFLGRDIVIGVVNNNVQSQHLSLKPNTWPWAMEQRKAFGFKNFQTNYYWNKPLGRCKCLVITKQALYWLKTQRVKIVPNTLMLYTNYIRGLVEDGKLGIE